MRIALAGNPNSGKTSLYNVLTGKTEYVGNWAGVTVEQKESPIKSSIYSEREITVVDLPGAYSMSPFTSEESITSDYVKEEKPDVIINIVDAVNLSRSLFFTTQLQELGIPVVVALNKSDMSQKKKIEIDVEALSNKISSPVVATVATDGDNSDLKKLIETAVGLVGQSQSASYKSSKINASDADAVRKSDEARFKHVNSIVASVEKRAVASNVLTAQDKADKIVANTWLGLPIFVVVMFVVFYISQTLLGPIIADYLVGLIEGFKEYLGGVMGESVSPIISALLLEGVIGGFGAVVGFLPLIMVLFFLLALLEDCGYMARVAVVMDRFFKKVGLNGRSIIPMVVGTGCAIPGVMATRTIKNERQRRTTAMLTPFIPCGAKLPVIALFAGVFFNNEWWVSPSMFFSGIVLIIVGALLIVRITGEQYQREFFIIELTEYKVPSIKRAALSMLQRGWAFVVKAATIILLCNVAVHIMQTFDWSFSVVEEGMENTSILASIANPFAILLIPIIGISAWQLAAAAITGFIAKEIVVGTLSVVYGITQFIDTDELALVGGASEVAVAMGLTGVGALAYMMFNLFTPPCFAAIGAMNAEMESPKWLWAAIGFQLGMGYVVAFFVYQIGTLVTTGALGAGFLPGLIAVAVMIGIVVFLAIKGSQKATNKIKATAKA